MFDREKLRQMKMLSSPKQHGNNCCHRQGKRCTMRKPQNAKPITASKHNEESTKQGSKASCAYESVHMQSGDCPSNDKAAWFGLLAAHTCQKLVPLLPLHYAGLLPSRAITPCLLTSYPHACALAIMIAMCLASPCCCRAFSLSPWRLAIPIGFSDCHEHANFRTHMCLIHLDMLALLIPCSPPHTSRACARNAQYL